MKTLTKLTIVFSFFFIVTYTHATDWNAFSKNLIHCLDDCNSGVQLSALQQIIMYADSLKVDDAVFNVVCIYRTHPDEKVRQLALSTLYRMQNGWAMNFLAREVKYEKSPALQHQIYHMLQDYNSQLAKAGKQKDENYLVIQN